MKRTFFLLFTGIIILIASILFTDQRARTPKPSIMHGSVNDEEQFKYDRERYFELLHAAAPGTDWRSIEEKNRRMKRQLIKNASRNKSSDNEVIVPGVLQGEWSELGSDNQAGRILSVDVDYQQGLIYAASEGGNIWTGTLTGQNWTPINENFNIDHIRLLKKIEFDTISRLLAVDSKPYVYYTDDMGQSWSEATGLEGPQSWGSIKKAEYKQDSTGTIFLLCSEWDYTNWNSVGTLYKSTDHGESFMKIHSSPESSGTMDIWTGRNYNSPLIFLNNDSVFFIADNSGLNFRSVVPYPAGSSPSKVYIFAYTDSARLIVYAGMKQNGLNTFYRSTDSCMTWELRGTLDDGSFSGNSYCCSLTDTNALFFGGVNAYRSYNQGLTWQMVNSWGAYYSNPESKLHADIPEITSFIQPNGTEEYFISTDGGLYNSTDHLLTVNNLSMSGLRVSQYYSIYSNRTQSNLIYAGSQDQGFQRSLDVLPNGIQTFDQLISGDYGHLVSGDGGNSVWAVYPSFVIYFPNISQTASPVQMKFYDFVGSNYLWMPPLMVEPNNPDQVWLAGGGSQGGAHLWFVNYNGTDLVGVEKPFDFSENDPDMKISALASASLNPAIRYLCTYPGHFWYSLNYGNTWTMNNTFDPPSSHYFYGNTIVSSPVDTFTLYIGGSGYSNAGVYKSTDHGQSFIPINTGLPQTMVYELAINQDGSMLFAATEAGPYVWIESEQEWFYMGGNTAPDQIYWSVDYVPAIQTVRFGTHGRGIWEFAIDSMITSVGQVAANEPLKVFPNPSAGTVYCSGLDSKYNARLEVMNVRGELVGIWTFGPGETIQWNGRRENGGKVIPGVYLIRIEQPEKVYSGKVVIY